MEASKARGWGRLLHMHLLRVAEAMSRPWHFWPEDRAGGLLPRSQGFRGNRTHSLWRWQVLLAHGAEVQVVHPLTTWVTLNMILHPSEGREQHLSPLEGWQQ